jgi:hypothetical protein
MLLSLRQTVSSYRGAIEQDISTVREAVACWARELAAERRSRAMRMCVRATRYY